MESSMDTEMQNERCSLEGFEQESNDRLVFPKLFYGREPELKQLRGIYEILVNVNKDNKSTDQTPQNSPLVLISGYSGTGKSALVDHFVQELKIVDASSQKQPHFNNCYLAKGKFDQSVSADPYSALVQAFTNFCTQLQEQPREEREVFKREMQHAVGEEGLQVLSQLIPALQAIAMEKDATSRTATTLYAPHTEYEWNRLSYLFRKLVQAMSTRNRPLILFLDDLQWIDPASLDLLMELVLDSASLKYCMIIGAFRSNEVDDKHPLWTKLLVGKGLSQDAPPQPPQSMIIPLENLSSEVTGKFLADTLWMQVEEVDMLTQAVHERTQGNIFFTKSLLEDLHRKQILYRNPMNDYLWTWDLPKITELQGLSENVVDIITSKLATLPSALQTALGMGSFLRSTFDASTLLVLLQKEEQLKKEPYCVWTLEELEHLLEGAVVEGLLQNSMGCRDYRFAHDKIKQAAHTMVVASDARDQLRVRIAKYLMERGNDPQHGEDWMLFVAADHLNAISPNGMRSLDLVLLNLQVGERAVHVSAFIPAAAYLRKGLDSLTTQVTRPWQDHYDITIRMYRAVADVELCLGYFDKGHELCRVIMQQAQSKSDKLVTSLSLGEALGRQKRHAEAMEVHQEALYLVKAGLPKNFHLAHVLKDFRKARTLFKKYSNYDILLLPTMQDEHKLSVMDHLSALSHRAFYCNKMAVVMLCILRQIRLTFAYGLCPDSAQGFSSYGLILCGTFGDQEFGNRMGRLARSVLELEGQRSKSKECHVLFTIAAYM
jgi:predicted ATPase